MGIFGHTWSYMGFGYKRFLDISILKGPAELASRGQIRDMGRSPFNGKGVFLD
jgi:hypothetical protein